MNKFHKVSFEQFYKDFVDTFGDKENENFSIKDCYNLIQLPKRATKGSAGYDFYSPVSFCLKAGETIKIPTGIRVEMDSNIVGLMYPRSSMGLKGMYILNTVPVVDSDYFSSKNEGHIFVAIGNRGKDTINIKAGDRFSQMILTLFVVTDDDCINNIRNGGYGSTGN